LFPANAFAAGLLVMLIFAVVTWPVQEYAQQSGGAAGVPSELPPINFAALSLSSSKNPLLLAPSAPTFDFRRLVFNGSLARTGAGGGDGGIVPGKPSFAPFNSYKLIVSPSGARAGSGGTAGKKSVGKGGLALGIVGAGVAVLGVVFVAASGGHTTCANELLSNACDDVHTAGEVMIPAGAAVAVTGFYLAFRHRQ
jgi:hypothetical protein